MTMAHTLKYGAAELKRFYNPNLRTAFIVSIVFHLLLLSIPFLISAVAADTKKVAPVGKMKLTNLPPPPPPDNATPPPPPPMIPPNLQTGGTGNGGVAARAGVPIAVPDALITPEMQKFATTDVISVATPEGGDGTGFSIGDGDGLGAPQIDVSKTEVKEKEEAKDPYEFVPVEKEPSYDESDLQRRVKYPEIAKRNGITGRVTVRVYVSKTGKAEKCIIEQSDNKILEEEARRAVLETVFTPAIQNGNPIGLWMSIPVNFQLN